MGKNQYIITAIYKLCAFFGGVYKVGYVLLMVSMTGGLGKGLLGRKVSGNVSDFKGCIFVNIMRLMFCALIGFLFIIATDKGAISAVNGGAIRIYALSAVSTAIFLVCWMYEYKSEAYVFLNIFIMLGSIVTCICGLVVYKEPIPLSKQISLLMILCAVFIMSGYNHQLGKKIGKHLIILVLGTVSSAIADFTQTIYVREIGRDVMPFNFYTYAIALIMLLIVYFIYTIIHNIKGNDRKLTYELYTKKSVIMYFSIAACLYLNALTKTMANRTLQISQIYPVLSGITLIASAIMAHILFKEKINRRSVCAMLMALAGIVGLSV